jgi:cytochrome c oxidase subunit IV
MKIISPSNYFVVYGCLIVLTFATVGISFVDLGESMHLAIGLLIAGCKALLVALFFMHALYSPRLTWAVIGAGLLWLGILLAFTLADYLTRPWLAY